MKFRNVLLAGFGLLLSAPITSNAQNLHFTDLAEMPIEITGMGSATDGEYIYSLNGNARGESNTWKFDPIRNEWKTWQTHISSKWIPNLEYHAGTGKLILFNGLLYQDSPGQQDRLNRKIELIDPVTGEVEERQGNPMPVYGAGSAVWEGKIYVFGGNKGTDPSDPASYSNQLWSYDPQQDSWERLADMPEPKQTNGEIVNGILYAFGGFNGTASNRIDAYDIRHGHWYQAGILEDAISGHSVLSYGGKIWIFGSLDRPDFAGVFDVESEYFYPLESNFTGRRDAGAAVLKGQIYLFGGTQKSPCHGVQRSIQAGDITKMAGQPAQSAEAPEFRVYPNPNLGIFSVYVKSTESVDFKLTAASGEVVYEAVVDPKVQTIDVNVSHLASGVYVATIRTQEGAMSTRVVVK